MDEGPFRTDAAAEPEPGRGDPTAGATAVPSDAERGSGADSCPPEREDGLLWPAGTLPHLSKWRPRTPPAMLTVSDEIAVDLSPPSLDVSADAQMVSVQEAYLPPRPVPPLDASMHDIVPAAQQDSLREPLHIAAADFMDDELNDVPYVSPNPRNSKRSRTRPFAQVCMV